MVAEPEVVGIRRPRASSVGRWVRTVAMLAACTMLPTCSAVGPPAPQAADPGQPDGSAGRTYHLSPGGDDAADGLTPATAWRSLARASVAVLAPGDRLLLEGGERFPGTLELGPEDGGDPARPVVIGAYGSGGPVLEAAGAPAVVVRDTAGIDIDALTAVGDAQAYATSPGILLVSERSGGPPLEHVHLTRIEVSGFVRGVEVAATGNAGFRDVLLQTAALHDNMEAGFLSHGPEFDPAAPVYAHEDVVLRDVAAFRNVGDPANATRNTGSGAVLGSVRRGLVEQSRFYENGASSRASEGPLGAWAYDATQVVIQQNVAYRNRTGDADGGGFGLDVNVSDSVIQYNLSYDNDGPGLQLYTWKDNAAHRGNTVRFNVSRDDARRTDHGALTVLGRVGSSAVYQNTVVLSAATALAQPPAVLVGDQVADVTIRDNVVVIDGAAPLVRAPALAGPTLLFQGNVYFARGGGWTVQWGPQTYSDLGSWQAATRQETVVGLPVGAAVDPGLADPDAPVDTAPPGSDLPSAAPGLRLAPTSPVIGRGLDLTAFGVDPGPTDFFGTPLAGATTTPGAHRPTAS